MGEFHPEGGGIGGAEFLHRKGLSRLKAGDCAAALRWLHAALRADPEEARYHCNIAMALRLSGDAEGAVWHCRQALALRPRYSTAQHNLGCALFDLKRFDDALAAFDQALLLAGESPALLTVRADALRELKQYGKARAGYIRALSQDQHYADAHLNLGSLLAECGDLKKALEHCRRGVDLVPDNGTAWLNLGYCLFRLEAFEEAMEANARAYALIPDSVKLRRNIAHVWLIVGERAEAILWYRQALELAPDDLDANFGLAIAQSQLGTEDQAIQQLQRLLDLHPDCGEAWCELGKALLDAGQGDDALKAYHRALELAPNAPGGHNGMALALTSLGRLDEAVSCHRRALELTPASAAALNGLAIALREQLGGDEVAQMHRLLDTSPPDEIQAELHGGLAHYYDASGDYARAAEHIALANQAVWAFKHRRDWDYDPDTHAAHVDSLIRHFNPDFFDLVSGLGDSSETPVFVVGMPRSGTTLTERILASHPLVHGVGERIFLDRSLAMLPDVLGRPAATPFECLPHANADALRQCSTWHLEQLQALAASQQHGNAARIVDKLPDNYLLLGWIAAIFPRARIIHCRRDPRDVALSCWFTQFSSIPWACHLAHIATRLREHQRLMAHWQDVLPMPILELAYEDLVADPETHSRRLVEWLGLTWDPACLSHQSSAQPVRTASATQVCRPIYSRSAGRWRGYRHVLEPALEGMIQI